MTRSDFGMMNTSDTYWLDKGWILPASKCCCSSTCQASLYLCGHKYCLQAISLLQSLNLKRWYMSVGRSSIGWSSTGNLSAKHFFISVFNLCSYSVFAMTSICACMVASITFNTWVSDPISKAFLVSIVCWINLSRIDFLLIGASGGGSILGNTHCAQVG